jgi:hypothetical protein
MKAVGPKDGKMSGCWKKRARKPRTRSMKPVNKNVTKAERILFFMGSLY